MTAYWAGWIGIDDELITEFFAHADDETRHYVIESVGRGLLHGDDPLEEDVIARLFALLDARIAAERAAPSIELSGFGLWFAAPRLPAAAVLRRLREIMALVDSVEPLHMVVERLAAIAVDAPRDTAELLAEIVDREPDGWRLTLWDESAASIIRAASASGDLAAVTAAHEAASRAAARGHLTWLAVE